MAFDIPRRPITKLVPLPLQNALVQLRFDQLANLDSADAIGAFQARLKRAEPKFVLIDQGVVQSLHVTVGPGGVSAGQQPVSEPMWRFRALPDTGLELKIAPGWMSVETHDVTQYPGFEAFAAAWSAAVMALAETFPNMVEMRLGIRFLSRLELANSSLTTALNSDLLCPVGGALGTALRSSHARLEFNLGDSTFALAHGLVDPKGYLLDLDHFRSRMSDLDPQGVIDATVSMHRVIEDVFAWSLHPDYLAQLEGGGASS